MNGHFRIIKGVGVEINGHLHEPPACFSEADASWAIGLAELAFEAGQREQLYRQLHATRVSRDRLDAIVPLVQADIMATWQRSSLSHASTRFRGDARPGFLLL